jgi:hypothetical protein
MIDREARILARIERGTRSAASGSYEAGPIGMVFGGLFFASFAFGLLTLFFIWLVDAWSRLSTIAATTGGALIISGLVVVLGGALYLIRERWRFAYSCLEIGSAFAAGFEACMRLALQSSIENSRVTLVFALLAAVYIAVRGFDNLGRHLRDRAALKTNARGA